MPATICQLVSCSSFGKSNQFICEYIYNQSLYFSYYDVENKGALTISQLSELFSDLAPKQGRNEESAANLLKSLGLKTSLDLVNFSNAFRQKDSVHFPNSECFLRWIKPYFDDASKKIPAKIEQPKASRSKSISKSRSKSSSKSSAKSLDKKKSKERKLSQDKTVLCSVHKPRQYEYSRHVVTLDTSGRCVDPRIINESKSSFHVINYCC